MIIRLHPNTNITAAALPWILLPLMLSTHATADVIAAGHVYYSRWGDKADALIQTPQCNACYYFGFPAYFVRNNLVDKRIHIYQSYCDDSKPWEPYATLLPGQEEFALDDIMTSFKVECK
ncbi:hypothetical protein BGZ81_003121 [Podila clonocystis]|nr:hypothetical protein BGZ81_003121 [Podila clonocystis]